MRGNEDETGKITIYVSVRQAGKRRAVLEKKEYRGPAGLDSLRKILAFFTEAEVEKYNSRDEDTVFLFDDDKLNGLADTGKVSFGAVHGGRKADPGKAVQITLECFSDGLIRAFQNDTELTDLDSPVIVNSGDTFTFIKLTFLAGRMW